MEIFCPSCNRGFLIPDEKIPHDRAVTILCPSCRGKIQVDLRKAPQEGQEKFAFHAPSPTSLEDEIESMGEDVKRALVCMNDKGHQEAFRSLFDSIEYQTRVSSSTEEVLERMRFVKYDVIVLHEEFDSSSPRTNPIVQRMKSMQMEARREIFFVLVGKELNTLNNMMALVKNANLVINEKDIPRIDQFLAQCIKENERFYRVFRETRKEIGKD